MADAIEISFGRVDRTYRPGELVSGTVTFRGAAAASHAGLMLRATGSVRPQADSRAASGAFDASRPIVLSEAVIEMAAAGKLPAGVPLPFEFTLQPVAGRVLTETYHGVYVSVKYAVAVTLARSGFMAKPLEATAEFVVEVPVRPVGGPCAHTRARAFHLRVASPPFRAPFVPRQSEKQPVAPVEFEISPASLENVKKASLATIPKFSVRGKLNKTNCSLNAPFTGEVTVVETATKIKSIELQLVRVETVTPPGAPPAREATEIQNLQIGDGSVCLNLCGRRARARAANPLPHAPR